MRKIVMLPPHEWLGESFSKKLSAPAVDQLSASYQTSGVTFSTEGYAVRIPQPGRGTEGAGVERVEGEGGYRGTFGNQYAMAAEFESEEAVEQFVAANKDVQGVFDDLEIAPFPIATPAAAIGTHQDVVRKLNLTKLHAAGAKGRGVRVVVVDTGIDGTQINVAGGYNPRPGVAPGTAKPDHGTMVAFDTLLAAPEAMIFDYALLQSAGGNWVGFLSDAIRAFSEILADHLQHPGPKVVVNSWGMYSLDSDAPLGNPQNYARNPVHPFNLMAGVAVAAGIDVVFAAGNCGSTANSPKCGGHVGPDRSIHGANSHPDVITVAAVTIGDDLLGYSSEGPGGLFKEKPDLAGFSHFAGSGVKPVDSGTSAACPVVAGVLAALRSTPSGRSLSPPAMKRLLVEHTRSVHGAGWSPQFGWGIVDADAAFASLPPAVAVVGP